MMRLNRTNMPIVTRWDKIKSFNILSDEITARINAAEREDEGITLDIGPQLMHTLRHPSSLRCIDISSSKFGHLFSTHYNKGAVQCFKTWTLQSKDKNGAIKHKAFETNCEITTMTYISKHRAYIAFCTDLTLRLFTDAHSNFMEIQCIPCLSTILCLIYNKEDDEIYAGGIGFIEEWKIHGAEHAAIVTPVLRFTTDLTRNEWIRDIKVVEHNQLLAVHGNGICIISRKTSCQIHNLPNRHDGPLKCCCYYYLSDYLVTGGADGKLKLFHGSAFNLLHVLKGHNGPISSVQPHKTDTLLFSSSLDGTVRIWRMDSLQMCMRLDVGEKIYRLSLLGDTEFFFQTEKNVLVYSLNQFYQLFSPVESDTKQLMRCQGRGKCSRILASTEDGSVRLFSPVTGLTLTIIYPMPSFQVLMSFAYDLHQDMMHTVLSSGKVLVYDTSTNPCTSKEIWVPACPDECVNILLLVTVNCCIHVAKGYIDAKGTDPLFCERAREEFMCNDGGLDIDNLVFAGLKNGQIMLCQAVVCSLQEAVQAHEGNIVCLNKCPQLSQKTLCLQDTSSMIISGGTDNFVKIWFIEIDTAGHRPIVNLLQLLKIFLVSAPTHISMFGNQLSVVIKEHTEQGVKWRLIMYQMISMSSEPNAMCNVFSINSTIPYQLTHSLDDDHSQELTALDVCPIIGVIMTSGKDGFIKIWSSNNQLLREMNFIEPIYACCFANDRGDILIGHQLHVCSVSVLKYLPVSYLRKILSISDSAGIKDDKRELPLEFDPKSEPWLNLTKCGIYSINVLVRRQEQLQKESVKKFNLGKESDTKFVFFVDGGKTKVITKELADKLLTWSKAKDKLGFGKKTLTDFSSSSEITNTKKGQKAVWRRSNFKRKYVDDDPDSTLTEELKDSEIYPSAVGKAIRQLETERSHLTPYEMRLLCEAELLKKDPIIAPDGYIPNSVIRQKLKPPKVDTLKRLERPFKLKPVPKINPDHMPSWWGRESEKEPSSPVRYRVMKWEDSPSPVSNISSVSTVSIKSLIESPVKKYIGEKSKTITPLSATPKEKRGSKTPGKHSRNDKTPIENVKKMIKLNEKYGKKKSGWEDSTSSEKPDTTTGLSQPSSAREDLRRSGTDLSDSSRLGNKHKPGTPSTTYKSGSARSCVSSTDSVRSKRIEFNNTEPRHASGGRSVERTKSFKLTNLAVDEDSSMIHIKESKSGRRVKNHSNSGIIQQLLEEKWMHKLEGIFEYEDVLDSFIDTIDYDEPVIYESVCKYIANLFTELGIPEAHLDLIIGKLGINLKNMKGTNIKHTLTALQVLGHERRDVILLILPKLIDPEEPVRNAAADTIYALTGAQDKDTLFSILDEMGITGGIYNSKADEEFALQTLAARFENQGDETQYFDRIQSWVQGTTPGLYDEEKEEDSLWTDGTRSRKSTQGKELSFMSDGKSVIDMFENSGLSGRTTMYADLPATPTYSSDDEFMLESREVSMMEGGKSQNSAYKARMDLMDRAGASVLPSDQRIELPTPISDAENDFYNDRLIEEGQESPIMADRPNSQRSPDMLLGERTLTDLSQVGPLPKFLSNDFSRQNVDNVSTDSAFESTFTTTEYATSHYSEKFTVSHADQQSSKRSEVSDETSNMFDVEQISVLEFEGDGDVDNCMEFDIKSMKMHGLGLNSNSNSMESEDDQEVYPGGISVEITPRDSGRKDSQDTPRSGSTFKKKLQDIDGFSTISDRSSLSRKSKRSGSTRTGSKLTHHTHDFDADNEDETLSEPVMSVKIRDILAYNSEDHSPTPSDRPGTSDRDRDDEFNNQLTTTDTMDTTTTDPNLETYDNLTIELLAERNALYSPEITQATSLTSPDPNLTAQTLVEDKSGDNGEASRKSSAGSKKANDESLSLTVKDVPVDPSGSSDSVSPRFTPRDPELYKYYDQQNQSKGGEKQLEEDEHIDKAFSGSELAEKDSDYKSISNVPSSQISERLSGQDSGIARDMSEFSQGKMGLRKEYGTEKGYMYGAPLSPVKSEPSIKGRHSARSSKSPKEWRKFFDELPNAIERRQMEQIKKEMEQGKLKATTLPPISYFADDIPMLPGEAGTRLLQTVKVGEKFPQHDMRHRIESVPGKLAVHTQNENGGLSNFGILQMKWTTGVPTVKDKLSPPRRIPQYRSPVVQSYNSYLVPMSSINRMKNEMSEEDLNLPPLSARSSTGFNHQSTSHYEWELPLPPPPAKESRTNIAALKKDHDNYCKYYDLVKKKLHLYTSQKRERSLNLPEVLVKSIREEPTGKSGSLRKTMSPSKTALGSQLFLPPIKLGQLVKIY